MRSRLVRIAAAIAASMAWMVDADIRHRGKIGKTTKAGRFSVPASIMRRWPPADGIGYDPVRRISSRRFDPDDDWLDVRIQRVSQGLDRPRTAKPTPLAGDDARDAVLSAN